ncbi:MAG: hypothetical protein ACLFMT_02170 [Halobacteriales archaeon]
MDEPEVSVDVKTPEEAVEVDDAADLVRRLRSAFGGLLWTARVESGGDVVHATGEGWSLEVRPREDEVVFEPAGSSLRLVRSVEDLDSVDAGDDGVEFSFGRETVVLGMGVDHVVRRG